jgi:hypothetical protein
VREKPKPKGLRWGGVGVKTPYITPWELWVTQRGKGSLTQGKKRGIQTLFYSCESPGESMFAGKNNIRVK